MKFFRRPCGPNTAVDSVNDKEFKLSNDHDYMMKRMKETANQYEYVRQEHGYDFVPPSQYVPSHSLESNTVEHFHHGRPRILEPESDISASIGHNRYYGYVHRPNPSAPSRPDHHRNLDRPGRRYDDRHVLEPMYEEERRYRGGGGGGGGGMHLDDIESEVEEDEDLHFQHHRHGGDRYGTNRPDSPYERDDRGQYVSGPDYANSLDDEEEVEVGIKLVPTAFSYLSDDSAENYLQEKASGERYFSIDGGKRSSSSRDRRRPSSSHRKRVSSRSGGGGEDWDVRDRANDSRYRESRKGEEHFEHFQQRARGSNYHDEPMMDNDDYNEHDEPTRLRRNTHDRQPSRNRSRSPSAVHEHLSRKHRGSRSRDDVDYRHHRSAARSDHVQRQSRQDDMYDHRQHVHRHDDDDDDVEDDVEDDGVVVEELGHDGNYHKPQQQQQHYDGRDHRSSSRERQVDVFGHFDSNHSPKASLGLTSRKPRGESTSSGKKKPKGIFGRVRDSIRGKSNSVPQPMTTTTTPTATAAVTTPRESRFDDTDVGRHPDDVDRRNHNKKSNHNTNKATLFDNNPSTLGSPMSDGISDHSYDDRLPYQYDDHERPGRGRSLPVPEEYERPRSRTRPEQRQRQRQRQHRHEHQHHPRHSGRERRYLDHEERESPPPPQKAHHNDNTTRRLRSRSPSASSPFEKPYRQETPTLKFNQDQRPRQVPVAQSMTKHYTNTRNHSPQRVVPRKNNEFARYY